MFLLLLKGSIQLEHGGQRDLPQEALWQVAELGQELPDLELCVIVDCCGVIGVFYRVRQDAVGEASAMRAVTPSTAL